MALSIAILGNRPSAGVRGVTTWGAWATHGWSDPTVLATDEVLLTSETSTLLILTSTAGAMSARIAGATVAAVRPDVSVRVEVLPVSVAVMVRAVETVPRTLTSPPAVFAAIKTALAATTWGAWMPSVTKLEQPAPSLGQHIRSWIARGAGFIAIHGSPVNGSPSWVDKLPCPQVEPSRRLPGARGADTVSAYGCHAFGDLPEDAIASLFSMGLGNRPTRREGFGDATAIWGSPKAVEFVISPTEPVNAGSSPLRLGPSTAVCPACAEPVWGSCCPFCRVTSRRSAPRPLEGVAG